MKKIILMLMLLTGFAALAKAQDTTRAKRTPEERAQHTTRMLQKKLALSADQTSQISAIIADRDAKMSDPQIQGKGSRLTKMEAMNDADKKINAVLTPGQQKMYAQIESDAKQKAMEKKQAKQTPPPVAPASQLN